MLILVTYSESKKDAACPFIVRFRGRGKCRERAPCLDEAIGQLAVSMNGVWEGPVDKIKIVGKPGDYFAFIETPTNDVYGFGATKNEACGALIRMNKDLFQVEFKHTGIKPR